MPFQQPLVPPVLHVADPENGWEPAVTGSSGETLFVEVAAADEGVVRVRPAPNRETRGRATTAATYGFGEKFTAYDKRGQRTTSWNHDAFSAESERAYKNVPFYLSTCGYGVLVDTGTPAEF